MTPLVSLYIDLVRVCAALVVMLGHFSARHVSGGLFWQFVDHDLGHTSVVLFFVLSGYVIAYSAQERERTLKHYLISRISRVYSVALPALLLSLLLAWMLKAHYPAYFEHAMELFPPWTQVGDLLAQFIIAGTFLNEIWFVHSHPLIDGPYWSLTYEVWYYAIFGAYWYLTAGRRWFVTILLCAVAGPKILAMMPLWLFGVAAWRFPLRSGQSAHWLLLIASSAALCLLVMNPVTNMHPHAGSLYWAVDYRDIDYPIGLAFALQLATLSGLRAPIAAVAGTQIKAAASYTFSIYLFHMPLLTFLGAVIPGRAEQSWHRLSLLAATSVGILLLGTLTEQKRKGLRDLLGRILRVDRPAQIAAARDLQGRDT
jgi:peptidoglycan/LPS O-acetylase OafA/YrhL